MAEISRRTFLARAGAGAAAAGVIAAVPTLTPPAGAAKLASRHGSTTDPEPETISATTPLVVHVPNPKSGEVHFMIGTREVVQKDRGLVARLLRDAR